MNEIRVVQFGNYGDDGGGISSVLREFGTWVWSESRHVFVDTYATAPQFWGVRRLLSSGRTLVRNRRNIDVAHVHLSQRGSFIREGLLVRLASALGLRVVVTIHGSSFDDFSERFPGLARGVLRKADEVAVLTRQTELSVKNLGLTSVSLIPNAVSAGRGDTASESLAVRRSIVFAGEVSRRKGVDVLLAAWDRVKSQVPDARLEIFGGVTDVSVPSDDAVTAHGRQPRARVRKAIRQARALVLPSRAEAFPMSILEAMSEGIPVVASDVGQVREMLDDSEFVVPAGDAPALASALVTVLTDDARASSVGTRNENRYQELYSPPVVMRAYEALYRPS